jgi:hypothetical protein
MRFLMTGLLALAMHAPAAAEQTVAQNRMYALIYEIKLDAEGKPTEIVVSKVIDASSGSTNAVNVPAPESVLARVRERVMKQTFEAGKASVFGYEPFYGAAG